MKRGGKGREVQGIRQRRGEEERRRDRWTRSHTQGRRARERDPLVGGGLYRIYGERGGEEEHRQTSDDGSRTSIYIYRGLGYYYIVYAIHRAHYDGIYCTIDMCIDDI